MIKRYFRGYNAEPKWWIDAWADAILIGTPEWIYVIPFPIYITNINYKRLRMSKGKDKKDNGRI